MTTYTVHLNSSGARLHERSLDGDDARDRAISWASHLAKVLPRTIEHRMKTWAHPSDGYQVGGPEIGDDGVWIEDID